MMLQTSTPAEAADKSYRAAILAGIQAHPRSQQKVIGPSQIGVACTRRLIHSIAQVEEPAKPDNETRLEAPIGTAFHAQLEEWFAADNANHHGQRWHVEQKVMVGHIGGAEIWGSTDLYDAQTGYVIDHKVVGDTKLKNYKANGPGQQYITQAMLYCRGWEKDGWQVNGAAIAFIPRGGLHCTLKGIYFHTIPYNEQIALDALDRANKLHRLINAVGLEQAASLYDPCKDDWCPWCAPANRVEKIINSNPFHFSN